jgi:hypothetical protein
MLWPIDTTIGIDPGAHAGVAIVRGSELLLTTDSRKVKLSDPWQRIEVLQHTLRVAGVALTDAGRVAVGQPFNVALERQYASSFAKASALAVAGHAAAWELSAQLIGGSSCHLLDRVAPSSWQAMIGAAKGKSRERKRRAAGVLLEHYDHLRGLGQGAIDATWIAIYSHALARGWDGKPSTPIEGWEWVNAAWQLREIKDA